jgi:hypothetical protein
LLSKYQGVLSPIDPRGLQGRRVADIPETTDPDGCHLDFYKKNWGKPGENAQKNGDLRKLGEFLLMGFIARHSSDFLWL